MSIGDLHLAVLDQVPQLRGQRFEPGDLVCVALAEREICFVASASSSEGTSTANFVSGVAASLGQSRAKEALLVGYGVTTGEQLQSLADAWQGSSAVPVHVYGVEDQFVRGLDGSTAELGSHDQHLPTRFELVASFLRDPSLEAQLPLSSELAQWDRQGPPSYWLEQLKQFLSQCLDSPVIPGEVAANFGLRIAGDPVFPDAVLDHVLGYPEQLGALKQLYLVVPEVTADRVGTNLATAYWLNGNGREANILFEHRPQMATATRLGELVRSGLDGGLNPLNAREIFMSKSVEVAHKLAQSDLAWAERYPQGQADELNNPVTFLDANQLVQPNLFGPGIGL